jgi:SAM-dependent methyltransferase
MSVRNDTYFSWNVGAGLVRFVSTRMPLRGLAVDVGCGPGFLLERLMAYGLACKGVDLSPESVAALTRRIGQNALFHGASVGGATDTGLADGEADVLFLVEVLEHLLPEDIPAAMTELCRVLAPGGRLVITVPNDEDLAKSALACPDCGCAFHKWQHVGSFSAQSLADLLASHGLTPETIAEVDFGHWQFGILRRLRAQFISRKSGAKPPHLVAIVRKG